MLEISLQKTCKNIKGVPILKDIDYTFHGGKIYGLKGKNGCGKTMLMRSIAGLMRPSSGHIKIGDKYLYEDIEVPESIGILIENPSFLPEYTGFKNLRLLSDLKLRLTDEEIYDVIKAVGLSPDDKRKVYKYSLGMKQRLGIAAAIMGKPEIILLDEPINAIDESGVEQIRDIIRSLRDKNRIIILACHDKEELEYLSDEIINMRDGMIV